MSTLRILPDDVLVEIRAGETLLDAALRAGVAMAHACGGHARCSTCRVEVRQGGGACSPRTLAEQVLADRLGFGPSLRLACQARPVEDMTLRRLVLDDDDVAVVDQRRNQTAGRSVGEERKLGILFADIRGFTAFSEQLPPHDVVHVLNRYFHVMGRPIASFGGTIDNYMGDGFMALFATQGDGSNVAHRTVKAGLAMLEAMEGFKPYLLNAYGRSFDIGVGVHVGEVVVGSVGVLGDERVTAIGDAVNFASRIESANKSVNTRLLVSDTVLAEAGTRLEVLRTHRVAVAGKRGEFELHEVACTE